MFTTTFRLWLRDRTRKLRSIPRNIRLVLRFGISFWPGGAR